jgi:hypothetical protein
MGRRRPVQSVLVSKTLIEINRISSVQLPGQQSRGSGRSTNVKSGSITHRSIGGPVRRRLLLRCAPSKKFHSAFRKEEDPSRGCWLGVIRGASIRQVTVQFMADSVLRCEGQRIGILIFCARCCRLGTHRKTGQATTVLKELRGRLSCGHRWPPFRLELRGFQYSSARMIVSMRVVFVGSAGSFEPPSMPRA